MDVEAQCCELGIALKSIIRAIFGVAQIITCIVILAVSKDEHPHVPLRGYVIGHICACAMTLALLAYYFCTSTGDEDEETSKTVTFFNVLLGLFYVAWIITGIVWVYKAHSTRSDSPQLYWLSVVLIVLSIVLGPGASCSCSYNSSD